MLYLMPVELTSLEVGLRWDILIVIFIDVDYHNIHGAPGSHVPS